VSAFRALIEGFRDLFRDRWRREAAAFAAVDTLDVICNQLDEPWIRDSGATARLDLPAGEALLLGIRERSADTLAAVRVWLDDDNSGIDMRPADEPGQPWPAGTTLDGFEVGGDPFVLCSLLDAATRRQLPETLREHDLELADSATEATFDLASPRWERLVTRARAALAVTRLLEEAIRDAPDRLRERARSDPARRVRREAAAALASHAGRRGVPRQVIGELLRSGDHATVRLAASRLLGGGRMELTSIAGDRAAPAASRAAAAICLCDVVPPPAGVLVRCLDGLPYREAAPLALRMMELDGSEEGRVARGWIERVSCRRSLAGFLLQHHARLLTVLQPLREPWVEQVIDRLLEAARDDGRLLDLAEELTRRGRPDLAGSAAKRLLEIVCRDYGGEPARALDVLRQLDADRISSRGLEVLLETGRFRPWLAALELARIHDLPLVSWQLDGLDTRFEGEELEALIAELGRLGRSAQPVLLGLLRRRGDRELLTTVVIALGQCGDVEAVEPLLELEERRGALGRQARLSIEQIQARLGEVERGGLSLAQGKEAGGELSMAGVEGELALADEDG